MKPECIITLAVFALLSCTRSPVAPVNDYRKISIDDIGWYFLNSPLEYNDNLCALELEVSIHYSGADLSLNDIEYAKFSGGNLNWRFNLSSSNFNDSTKCIGCRYSRFYSTSLSANGSVMPIDTYHFEVKLINGYIAAKKFVIPAPGATQSNGYKYIYSEDFSGPKTSFYTPMLKRPTPLSALKLNDTIMASFSINDSLALGGWIWLYDISNTYIGKTEYFVDYTTKVNSPALNNGSGLYSSGQVNLFKITDSNCMFQPGKAFADIGSMKIILTDGRQYINTQLTYDCRSLSPLLSIN